MRRMRIITVSLLLAALTILALAEANPGGLFFPQQSQEPVENTGPTLSTNEESARADVPTLQTDKTEYIVEETVVFSGTGYTPGGTSYVITIGFDGQVLETLSFNSSQDGSIPSGVEWPIPFDAQNGTYVAKAYNNTGPSTGVLLASTEFKVNATMAARAEAIFRELEALNATIKADVEGINVSLTQKISVVAKKIEQFTKWVEEDKNNTAANMLNAAVNNLKALIHHVEAQKGKHIDEETANQLIAQAEELITKMETTMSSMNTKGKGKQVSTQARTQEQEMEREGRGQGESSGKGKAKGRNK
jgi:hypothetical protein